MDRLNPLSAQQSADLFLLEARAFRKAASIVTEYGHGAAALLHRVARACEDKAAQEIQKLNTATTDLDGPPPDSAKTEPPPR
jgi:hypothetical protein